MQDLRILMLTTDEPEGNAGSGVVLRGILDHVPCSRLLWSSVWFHPMAQCHSWRPEVRRWGFFPLFPGRLSPLMRRMVSHFCFSAFPQLACSIFRRLCRVFKPDLVWGLAGRDTIVILNEFMKQTNVPVHLSIHDDPLAANRTCPPVFPLLQFEKIWSHVFSQSRSWDVISESMKERYSKDHRQEGVVVTRGIPREAFKKAAAIKRDVRNGVNLVIGGYLDCASPWPQNFVKATELLERQLGIPVRLFAFDHTFPHLPPRVTREKYVAPGDFELFLQSMHIGVAGDRMGEDSLDVVKYAFSTKVLTYLCHGLPTFYYGYREYNVGSFLKKTGTGVSCQNDSPEAIKKALLRIVSNYDWYAENCRTETKTSFIQEDIAERFWQYIT